MANRIVFAVFFAVLLGSVAFPSVTQAQSYFRSTATSTAIGSVSIIDGISLGIKKSQQLGYTVSVDANGARPTVSIRSAERTITLTVPIKGNGFEFEIEKSITPVEIIASFE